MDLSIGLLGFFFFSVSGGDPGTNPPYTSLLDRRGSSLGPARGLFCMFQYINKGLLLQSLDSWGLVKDSQKLPLKIPRILN